MKPTDMNPMEVRDIFFQHIKARSISATKTLSDFGLEIV